MTPEQLQALNKSIAPAAVACEKATAAPGVRGVPAELTTAQCGTESAWLAHAPGNNAFGIKSTSPNEKRQLLPTKEWLNDAEAAEFMRGNRGRRLQILGAAKDAHGRRQYNAWDYFRAYDSLADCFADHAKVLRGPAYQTAWQRYGAGGTLDDLIAGIAAHYATDPNYAELLKQIAHEQAVTEALTAARAAAQEASHGA
jgi:flagellum-specific peptidoglycan hydrolase FlgJ